MRTDLDRFAAAERRELERVVQLLFEECNDAQATATGKRKLGRILNIILFGSYARGGWGDEPHTAKGYQSDYDLLIIVHTLGQVNDAPAHGRYFFMDIARDGCAFRASGERTMAPGPGPIAFTGFNADGADNLAFVALEEIPAGR